MSTRFGRWIVLELMRPVVLFGSLVEKLGRPWFLPRAIRASKANEAKFASEILRDLPFLFEDYRGQILTDQSLPHPRSFDFAVVIVAVDELLVRLIRGRGDLRVQVAARSAAENWGELQNILSWLGWREDLGPRSFTSLTDVGEVLKPHMGRIRESYSERYPEIRTMLSEAKKSEEAAARQLSADINRRLRR